MATGLYVEDGPIEGADAWIVGLGKMALARVRETIEFEGQRRFAIAHELGHWRLHPGINQCHIDTQEQIYDSKKDPIEVEASAFAAEILMPRDLYLRQFWGKAPGLETLLDVAKRFRVGPTAAAKRYIHLTEEDCLLVAHRDGEVCWYDPSSNLSLPCIYPKHPVPKAVVSAKEPTPYRRIVSGSEWYGEACGGLLVEETVSVSDSPALTLLSPIKV